MNLPLGRYLSAPSATAPAFQPRSETLRLRLFMLLLAFDAAAMFVSIRLSDLLHPGTEQWTVILAIQLPLYVLCAFNTHAFDADAVNAPVLAATRAAKAFVAAFLIVVLVAFSVKASQEFSRLTVALAAVTGFVTLTVGRYLIARNAVALLGGNPYSTVLICDGEQAPPSGAYSVVIASDGYFDPESDDPAMYDRLSKALDHADRVVVVCPPGRRSAWAHALKGANIQGEILVPEISGLAPLGVATHGGAPAMIVTTGPLKLVDRALKRGFDLFLASLAILLLAPLFLLVALLVKFGDHGPILFTQIRIGRANQQFRMYKFRSMRVASSDADGRQSTQRDDDRITPIGRLIRATSIDEIPQLFNVLAGHMSIVGPRT